MPRTPGRSPCAPACSSFLRSLLRWLSTVRSIELLSGMHDSSNSSRLQTRRGIERRACSGCVAVRAHATVHFEALAELNQLVRLQQRMLHQAMADWLNPPRIEIGPIDVDKVRDDRVHELPVSSIG